MTRPSSRFHLAVGAASLVLTVMLFAVFIDVLPDTERSMRVSRAAFAETLAINASALLSQGNREPVQDMLQLVRQRNQDIVSIGLRDVKGELATNIANHAGQWDPAAER